MKLKNTITTLFMVPTLKIGRENLTENNFLNAYIKDGDKDVQYTNGVYLLFHPKSLDKFREFLDEQYEKTKSIIDDYDYEGGFVVVVYQLDKKFNKDFTLVKQGKYSKTSKEFQNLFSKTVKVKKNGLRKDEISLQHRIFNKTEDLIKYWEDKLGVDFDNSMEVWQGWIEENETLFIDKLKEEYV